MDKISCYTDHRHYVRIFEWFIPHKKKTRGTSFSLPDRALGSSLHQGQSPEWQMLLSSPVWDYTASSVTTLTSTIAAVHQPCYITAVVKNNNQPPQTDESVHLPFTFLRHAAFSNLLDPILLFNSSPLPNYIKLWNPPPHHSDTCSTFTRLWCSLRGKVASKIHMNYGFYLWSHSKLEGELQEKQWEKKKKRRESRACVWKTRSSNTQKKSQISHSRKG